MKTLVVLLTLAAVATASPTVFSKDEETIKHITKLDDALLSRQKKSPLEDLTENIEDAVSNLAEERHSGLKKPIVINKKFGIHHLRNADTEERESTKECETPVKVNVCNDEAKMPSRIMKPTTAARSDIIMTENEMENSLQMAKEAVENLHRDLLNIEKSSQATHSRTNTGLESELHSNIEIARKALENIHNGFGDLETMNLKRESPTSEDGLKEKLSEVERLAEWKEAMENAQRDMEIARNIEDSFKSEDLKKDVIEELKNSEDTVKEQLRSDTDVSETKDFVNDMKFEQSLDNVHHQKMESEKQKSDVDSTHMMQAQINNRDLQKEPQMKMVTDVESTAPFLQENSGLTMKSNEPIDFTKQMPELREPANTLWAQEKSSDDGKQKLFDTLSMRLSENDKRQETLKPMEPKKQMTEHHEMRTTPDMHAQEQTSFKMSPTNMMQQQSLNMHQHHASHMPMSVNGHHHTLKQFGMNFDQNNVNVFQNQDNSMMEMNQQQTAEDPFFMRWAEGQRNAMRGNSGMNLRNDFRSSHMDDLHMDPVSQFEMAGADDLSALGTSMHDHEMHVLHHAHMDGAMQPSMRMNTMNMRHEYSPQWANQALARSSYGAAASAASAASSGDAGSPGAVGVFPNAKVGGCAIPILVSCSPSLATGTLAKAQPPSYSSGYRSGDNMVYYMKRDAKEDDLPILKVQRSHAPYNHKTELVLEKIHE